ncbi:MAG: class I SAM-dependent RNA methyltransferase [Lentisphaerae bacterium]|jgi:23S rRNA (uracil1939-C5)-methyltransferase|nr:class I SAM-dependent RNA methyltransferase [Lentisphaerota bacterium]
MTMSQYEQVYITDIAYGGDGVGRLADGNVVFVPYAAMGDLVEIMVTERKKLFCRGVINEIIEPSADRTTPKCRYYGKCGGCAYQHLNYEAEIDAKTKQFNDLIRRIGKFESFPEPELIFPSPLEYGYRNKIRLEPGERELAATGYFVPYGYYMRDNTTFFMVRSCPLAQEPLNALLPRAIRSDWGKQNAKRKKPYTLTLRVTTDGETSYYFGQAPLNMTWLRERLLDVEYRVPVGGFWQVNPPVAERLLEIAKAWTADLPVSELIDVYGGAGTFTMQIGQRFAKRALVESDIPAVEAADFTFQEAAMPVTLWKGTADEFLPADDGPLAEANLSETLLVLDPPRSGCQPSVLQALIDRPPKFILYVSCNVATLARDLKILCDHNLYKPTRSAIFDMFPKTAHFESMTLLERQ